MCGPYYILYWIYKTSSKVFIFCGFTIALNDRFLTNQIKVLLGSQLFQTYPYLPQCKIILYLNDNYSGLGFRICWKMQVHSFFAFLCKFWPTYHYTAYRLLFWWINLQNPLYIEHTKNSYPLTATKYPGLPLFFPYTHTALTNPLRKY